jgi:hypothetical protein
MNKDYDYRNKLIDWIDDVNANESHMVVGYLFGFIFPRPMDKAGLLKSLVDYGLQPNVLHAVDGRFSSGSQRMSMFVPDDVLAQIDPDSTRTFLKLQRLRRKQFIQRLRRQTIGGVSGVRMSLNWELIYDRLSEEYDKVLAHRDAIRRRSMNAKAEVNAA